MVQENIFVVLYQNSQGYQHISQMNDGFLKGFGQKSYYASVISYLENLQEFYQNSYSDVMTMSRNEVVDLDSGNLSQDFYVYISDASVFKNSEINGENSVRASILLDDALGDDNVVYGFGDSIDESIQNIIYKLKYLFWFADE